MPLASGARERTGLRVDERHAAGSDVIAGRLVGPVLVTLAGCVMERKRRKVAKKYLDIWATNAELERKLKDANQIIRDLRWDNRALRVQVYSQEQYANAHTAYLRRADRRRSGDPVDADPDGGEVTR